MVMTQAERDMLDAVADAEHRSAGDWIRLAILRAFESLPPPPAAPKAKRRA